MIQNHIFGTTCGSVFYFWNFFGLLGTFQGSPERTILELVFLGVCILTVEKLQIYNEKQHLKCHGYVFYGAKSRTRNQPRSRTGRLLTT